MTRDEIVAKTKALGFPKGSYIVFGSCPLAVAGIRESADIDMLVSARLLASLKQEGWKMVDKGKEDKPLTFEEFEAHSKWSFSSYSPTLKQLLATATYIDEVPFASLEEVRKWKAASGRPKDIEDIKLIDAYLKT